MRSERLPGKVLLDIAGETMLERVVRRVQRASLIDQVIVATSGTAGDDPVAELAAALGAGVFRGSEEDVLGRFAGAARMFDAGVCVRVSADSPFVDPDVADLVIESFAQADPPVDYASNKLEPSYPLGLDVEVFSRDALERAHRDAAEPWERAHVTAHIYGNPERFRLMAVKSDRDLHTWRWTVDTAEDLEFARSVFARLEGRNDFSWLDVVALIEREPTLASINAHVTVKPLSAG
jgi:spore coat polysaccharide biosynthesis protein SpsF (cytidylyltransferase family)